jgi:hypothetical protein
LTVLGVICQDVGLEIYMFLCGFEEERAGSVIKKFLDFLLDFLVSAHHLTYFFFNYNSSIN